jgi:hypothetical protein
MTKLITAAFLASTLAGIGFASAMPLAPSPVGRITAPDLIEVAGGCGPGFHRGPFNGCRRNFANPAAHACPRGYHIGPGGRCRGNGR